MGIVRTQYRLGSYHEAARAATTLLANANLSPEVSAEARYLRGKSLQQVNEVEKAMEDFSFSHRIPETYMEPRRNLSSPIPTTGGSRTTGPNRR